MNKHSFKQMQKVGGSILPFSAALYYLVQSYSFLSLVQIVQISKSLWFLQFLSLSQCITFTDALNLSCTQDLRFEVQNLYVPLLFVLRISPVYPKMPDFLKNLRCALA